MAQNVIINGVTYSNVPEVDIPKDGGGTAKFIDTSDATLDNGDLMASGVTAYADGVKYTGSLASRSSADLSASGATVTAPAGYYSSAATKTISSGNATMPATISGTGSPDYFGVDGNGLLEIEESVSATPVVSAGYISSGSSSTTMVHLEKTVPILQAQTITPTTSNQVLSAGTWLYGNQTISGDANLVAGNIKSGVSIFGVAGSLTSATVSQDGVTKVLSIS